MVTQLPLKKDVPVGHAMQSVDDGPLQVWHDAEQRWHCSGLGPNDIDGQGDDGGSHFVLSVRSWLKPPPQELQSPVSSWQSVHPS